MCSKKGLEFFFIVLYYSTKRDFFFIKTTFFTIKYNLDKKTTKKI